MELPILTTVVVILSLIGALAIQFAFLSQRNEGKFTGFLGWIYEFFHFRKMLLEAILRFVYIFSAIFLVVGGFCSIFINYAGFGQRLLAFLVIATVGNLILRLSYELLMMGIVLCRNVGDINRKMGAGLQNTGNQPQPQVSPGFIQQQPPQAPTPAVQQQPPQAPAQPPKASPQPAPQGPKTTANAPTNGPIFQPSQQPGAPARPAAPAVQTPQPPSGGKTVVFCRKCGQQFDGSLSACPNCNTPRN